MMEFQVACEFLGKIDAYEEQAEAQENYKLLSTLHKDYLKAYKKVSKLSREIIKKLK